jgi:D-sedoheptulose 7-phosphate isomerase
MQAIQSAENQHLTLLKMSEVVADSLRGGGCLYICGNGGSAADAQHLAAEFVGRFKKDRPPLRAVALTTDTSLLTAIGNDYGFNAVFERQVQAHVGPRDVLLCISTSGNSENVLHAAHAAILLGARVISLTGRSGGELKRISGVDICIESADTAAIQEAHLFVEHQLIAYVEEILA